MGERNPWKTKSTRTAYENPWITVEHNEVLDPSGQPGIYGVVRFDHIAVGVVTLDEAGNTHLIGQYRYALSAYSWEIPEGGCPSDEEPLDTAKRELQEEAGLTARQWTELLVCDVSNSVTDERGVIFLAEGLTSVAASPESTEELRLKLVPFPEAVDMALDGRIRDALSQLGLMAAERLLAARKS